MPRIHASTLTVVLLTLTMGGCLGSEEADTEDTDKIFGWGDDDDDGPGYFNPRFSDGDSYDCENTAQCNDYAGMQGWTKDYVCANDSRGCEKHGTVGKDLSCLDVSGFSAVYLCEDDLICSMGTCVE